MSSTPRQFYWRSLHIPFIAPWTGERARHCTVVLRRGRGGEGIGYADESGVADRRHGVLWVRQPAVRGVGEPLLAGVHALRQRQAMSHMLCQVCGTSALGKADERHLFLMRDVTGKPIGEGERTATPPVCQPCAVESVLACPHLRKGHTAALVRHVRPWGVAGIVYDPRTLTPLPNDVTNGLVEVEYTNPVIRWTLAARDVVTLHDCTTVDLEQLVATGRDGRPDNSATSHTSRQAPHAPVHGSPLL
ncbi:hypothetical protein [Streptomyces zagrosensis]|uniref:Uncharacterized protein n=1 Tax=Streptomyces zagrosensis TaxID=1042984 RepID=A0A7W9QGS4_9ACTN|nr:hypothetical protein [Streptomyces zagrosensis]MBB5940001.1 hypothetical protein [Streptomyces zagrosensis]